MNLPPYSTGVYWTEYKIDTPTFALAPVEKPDMSPFLFHMTGRNEIVSILSGNDREVAAGVGYLRACIPESSAGLYDAEVVCFTESPTFALDFFRYRSYHRWRADQLFGIGFEKADLVALGARPCVYADDQLRSDIFFLKNYVDGGQIVDQATENRLAVLISRLYPLITPLLEGTANQGFMWEREWRYSNDENVGLIFPYTSIKIICCPKREEQAIRDILGESSNRIQFVRSWKEYNEVTAYLKRRKTEMPTIKREAFDNDADFLSALEESIKPYINTLHSISAYQEFIDAVGEKKNSADEGMAELNRDMQSIIQKIRKLKEKHV